MGWSVGLGLKDFCCGIIQEGVSLWNGNEKIAYRDSRLSGFSRRWIDLRG